MKSFLEADLAELGDTVELSELEPPHLHTEVAGAQAGLGNRSGMFCPNFFKKTIFKRGMERRPACQRLKLLCPPNDTGCMNTCLQTGKFWASLKPD